MSISLLVLTFWVGAAHAGSLDRDTKVYQHATEQSRQSRDVSVVSARASAATIGCALPVPLPSAPPNGFAATSFSGAWSNDDVADFTAWREPCGMGTVVYLRAVPVRGVPFFCGAGFNALQALTQYDVKFIRTTNGSSFCDDLLAPVTVAIDQWSFDAQFDTGQPFRLVYEGVYANYAGDVLGTNGIKPRQWIMVELSPTEEGNMRGAINFYNQNLTQVFYRMVLEERTYERYRDLAHWLGMPVPPAR